MKSDRMLLHTYTAWFTLCWLLTVETQGAQIPSSMLLQMARMNSTRQFMLNMVVNSNRSKDVPPGENENLLFTEAGDVNMNGVDAVVSQVSSSSPGGCAPAMRPVNLPTDSDPTVVYFPSCVNLQRCGGCCGGDTLECGPSKATTQIVSVVRTRYPSVNAGYLEFDGIERLSIEVHLACECRCKVQPYHCDTQLQVYEPEDCRCKCKNEEQATQCPLKKTWNETKCACVCTTKPDCLPGELYQQETCSCVNTTPAPPKTNVYDPCARKTCPPGYTKRKVSDYSCRCEFASSLPRRRSYSAPAPTPPTPTSTHHTRARSSSLAHQSFIAERFPMMRAGVFDKR